MPNTRKAAAVAAIGEQQAAGNHPAAFDENRTVKRLKLDRRHLKQDVHGVMKKRGESCHILPTYPGTGLFFVRFVNNQGNAGFGKDYGLSVYSLNVHLYNTN